MKKLLPTTTHCLKRHKRWRKQAGSGRLLTLLLLAGLGLAALTSCGRSEAYSHSAIVPDSPWTMQDTLFFPIHIAEEPDLQYPLQADTAYMLLLGLRHSASLTTPTLGLTLGVQQLDSAGRPAVSVLRHSLRIEFLDEAGAWRGSSWGSFILHQTAVQDLSVSFPKAGEYRFYIVPEANDSQPCYGMNSVVLSLR